MKISIIIPVYNDEKYLEKCLDSIFSSKWSLDYEVIVIDDKSTDNSKEIVKKYPCKFIGLNKRSGPAHARNIGIKHSKGEILFFIDSNCEIKNDTLKLIKKRFLLDKNIYGIIGLPDKVSLNKGFASNFNALKNHFSLYSAKNKYTNYFTTQSGALKREVFEKYGCFNEKYKRPLIEDIEYGLRFPHNKIYIEKKILVKHCFPNFKTIIKKYFVRSILLTKLIKEKNKIPNSHANAKRFLATIPASLSLIFLIASLFYIKFVYFSLFMGFLYITLNLNIFRFVYNERGLLFALLAFFSEYIFALVINLGWLIGLII